MTELICLTREQVKIAWPEVVNFLKPFWSDHLDMIAAKCLAEHYQVWFLYTDLGPKAVFITALLKRGDKIALAGMYFAGHVTYSDLVTCLEALDQFKTDTKAFRFEIWTDHKIDRILRKLGYQKEGSIWWRY